MELLELKEHLDHRLDKLEDKMDNHIERIVKTEADVSWIRGSFKIIVSIIVAILGFISHNIYHLIHK